MRLPRFFHIRLKITDEGKKFFIKFGVSFAVGFIFGLLLLGFFLFVYRYFPIGYESLPNP